MILQRWQTVYLLVAIAAMIVFLLNPITVGENQDMLNTIWIAVAGWVDVTLAALAVVTFRRLKLQKMLAALCGVVSLIVGLLAIYIGLSAGETCHWTAFCPLAATVMAWLAYFAISSDKRMIESADRLWN